MGYFSVRWYCHTPMPMSSRPIVQNSTIRISAIGPVDSTRRNMPNPPRKTNTPPIRQAVSTLTLRCRSCALSAAMGSD